MADLKKAQLRRKRSNIKYKEQQTQLIENLSAYKRQEFNAFLSNFLSREEKIDGEVWVDFKDWEELYLISSHGRIKSKITGRIKIPHLHHSGYYTTSLHKNGEATYLIYSRLIGQHFVENIYNLPEINHKNKIRIDNRLSNLEWSLPVDNARHKFKSLTYEYKRPIIQMDLNYSKIKTWGSIAEAADSLKASAGNIITGIKRNKVRYGFMWAYETLTSEDLDML